MTTKLHHRGYDVVTTLSEPEAKELLSTRLDERYERLCALKDNKHNFVAQVETKRFPNLIVKEPRKRNKRRWERTMTLFRPGEAVRIYTSHQKLLELGFLCPPPLLAAEFRKHGVVTNSFVIYRFQEGHSATSRDAQRVSHELQRLHQKGYTRGDPKALNFLVNKDEVYFIDFKLAKPVLFRKHSIRMEYAHFLHTMPEGINYLPQHERESAGFLFAIWLRRAISDLKRKKRDWREGHHRPVSARRLRTMLLLVGTVVAYKALIATA